MSEELFLIDQSRLSEKAKAELEGFEGSHKLDKLSEETQKELHAAKVRIGEELPEDAIDVLKKIYLNYDDLLQDLVNLQVHIAAIFSYMPRRMIMKYAPQSMQENLEAIISLMRKIVNTHDEDLASDKKKVN